jgi:hypothetical protein
MPGSLQEVELSLEGVVQDPLVPPVLKRVEEKASRPEPRGFGEPLPGPGRGGIEGDPSKTGKPDLYPGMSLVLGHGQVFS